MRFAVHTADRYDTNARVSAGDGIGDVVSRTCLLRRSNRPRASGGWLPGWRPAAAALRAMEAFVGPAGEGCVRSLSEDENETGNEYA